MRRTLMTSQLPRFQCFSQLPAATKSTKNGAAVTSLRYFVTTLHTACPREVVTRGGHLCWVIEKVYKRVNQILCHFM